MLHKYLLLFLLPAFTVHHTVAQNINWATDVAPILYGHCVQCHRDGGLGGFSLIGYDNAFTYSASIQDATGARRMPPWKAEPMRIA
jgi:mono/diheme cytochrome c family protein